MGGTKLEIMLDKPRHLILNLNVVREFEQATGKNFSGSLANLSGSDMLALLWASLRQEEETLSLHAVGDMAHAGKWNEIDQKLAVLISEAAPEEPKKKTSKRSKKQTSSP